MTIVEGVEHLVPELEAEEHSASSDCPCRPIHGTTDAGRTSVIVHGLR